MLKLPDARSRLFRGRQLGTLLVHFTHGEGGFEFFWGVNLLSLTALGNPSWSLSHPWRALSSPKLLLSPKTPLMTQRPNKALESEKTAFSLRLGGQKQEVQVSVYYIYWVKRGLTALHGRLGHLQRQQRGSMSYFPVWGLWLESRFWARLFKHSSAFEELYEWSVTGDIPRGKTMKGERKGSWIKILRIPNPSSTICHLLKQAQF